MNRFDTDKLYELDSFEGSRFPLQRICNKFVHSIFLWMVYDVEGYADGDGTVIGVHLTSSYDKEKHMYWLTIDEIVRVFSSVIDDEFRELQMYRDPDTNEMKVKKD